MAAEGDWLAALYEYAQQQGPEAVESLRQGYTNMQNTVGQQWSDMERAAGGGTWVGDTYYAASTPQAAAARTDARYGTDMSWLDPTFQYQPGLLGQSATSQVYSDPAAQAAQWAALNRASQMTDTPLNFQGSGQQQGLMDQWGGVRSGQGAPSFMGGSQQQQLMNQLLGVQSPQFSGDADQRAVLNQALGLSGNTGPGALQFDTSGRQAEQYGNLRDIISGGGATAIEMANRQAQRADQESWLRGQREADMADYAERGLTGSGMELLALSGDRQAAAGRNSLADLETAKALEERRLGAINSAAGLAGTMRGQTIDEQSLLNSRAFAGLGQAADVANAMRNANYNEQAFLNTSAREQAMQAAQIAETMRQQGYNENTYLDQRMLNALQQQTALSGQMRDQTMQEQIAGRNAQQSALGLSADLASQLRNSSYNEAMGRAEGADQFSILNQSAINNAMSANTSFLQNAYQQMMLQRQQWEQNLLNQGINVSQGLMSQDQSDAGTGWNQAQQLGASNANTFNNANNTYNNTLLGAFNQNQSATNQANQAYLNAIPQWGQAGADFANLIAQMGAGAGSQPTGGAIATGGGGNTLSQPGTTWAQSAPNTTSGSGYNWQQWLK